MLQRGQIKYIRGGQWHLAYMYDWHKDKFRWQAKVRFMYGSMVGGNVLIPFFIP